MIKRLALLKRRGDLTTDAFRRYWAGPHGELAKAMPRLAGYKQNPAEAVLFGPPNNEPGFQVDGLAELWFASADDMAVAFGSPAGQALPADEIKFLGGITILAVTEATLRPGGGPAKVFLLIAGGEPALAKAIAAGKFPQILACAENPIEAVVANPDLWTEPSPPTAAFVLRFASAEAAATCFDSSEWKKQVGGAARPYKIGAFLVTETTLT